MKIKSLLSLALGLVAHFTVLAQKIQMVADINPGGDASPASLTVYNGRLLFAANNGTADGLWSTDGSSGNAILLKNIKVVGYFTQLGNILYFDGYDATHGSELWATDGTAAGTVLVKEIVSGSFGSDPQEMATYNGKLYFSANDGIHGFELWQSDGTAAGTVMVKDILPGKKGGFAEYISVYKGKMYFASYDTTGREGLWESDGTAAGTLPVKRVQPSPGPSQFPGHVGHYTEYKNRLYFQGNNDTTGGELWSTDGTAAGTVLVKDINPGANSSIPTNFMVFNDKLYFMAVDSFAYSYNLWMTDGTSSGTVKVLATSQTGHLDATRPMAIYNGNLYFASGGNSSKLYMTDGTVAGTHVLKNINPANGAYPTLFNVYNSKLYFTAIDAVHGTNLWETDGTNAVTTMLRPDTVTTSDPLLHEAQLVEYKSSLYFAANYNSKGLELWKLTTHGAGIDGQQQASGNMTIYPNPLSGNILNIKNQQGATERSKAYLQDIQGKIISSYYLPPMPNDASAQVEIPASVSNGLYFLVVQSGNGISSQKVMIQR
jgi:ELWxxDGT repeat protein